MLLQALEAEESYGPVVERAPVLPISQKYLSSRLGVYCVDFLQVPDEIGLFRQPPRAQVALLFLPRFHLISKKIKL